MSNIKPTIQIFNAMTGDNTIREMTDEEIAEHEASIADSFSLPTE
jgi:hypothetical protein